MTRNSALQCKKVSFSFDNIGATFPFFSSYEVLAEHPKPIVALGSPTGESGTVSYLNKSASCSDGGDAVSESSQDKPSIEHRKLKTLESRKDLIRKKLKFTKEATAAQKHRNEMLQAQHEMALFTCKVDNEDEKASEYFSLVFKKTRSRAHLEAKEADKMNLE